MSSPPGSPERPEPEGDPGSVADAELVGATDPGVDASYAALLARRETEKIEGHEAPEAPGAYAGVARNTAIFSIATGLSRVAGLAREIVRTLQEGRKAAGLEVSDRIEVWWTSADDDLAGAVREHAETIASEVLATSFAEAGPPDSAASVETDLPITLALRRA